MDGVTIKFLVDSVADGSVFWAGDTVKVSGGEAARLVRAGNAELVKEQPENAAAIVGNTATQPGGEVR